MAVDWPWLSATVLWLKYIDDDPPLLFSTLMERVGQFEVLLTEQMVQQYSRLKRP